MRQVVNMIVCVCDIAGFCTPFSVPDAEAASEDGYYTPDDSQSLSAGNSSTVTLHFLCFGYEPVKIKRQKMCMKTKW